MGEPLVSILIPFKDTAIFLNECLDSICLQTYKNWEVIAVNDHSNDASEAIVATYVIKDKRFRLLKNKKHGIIPALQTAYAISNGVFITRMDSDDIMKPEKLKHMVTNLLQFGKGHIALGQVHYFSERGISNGYERYETWLNKLSASGSNYSEIYKECVIPSPSWMVYKSDLEACDAFYSNRYPEDYDLTFRFYEKNIRCIPCDAILHLWRDYDSRTSRTSEHYAQNYFLDIKLHYFLKIDYDATRPLVVWGAGFKGKTIAKKLIEREINFHWLCDNPKKIGKKIYDQEMSHYTMLEDLAFPQSIITVANEEAQEQIRYYLAERNYKSMVDYFFFC